jgi:hypothetical protein
MKIDANFLFEHTGSTPEDLLHDQVLHTASWIAVCLLATTAVALIAAWLRRRRTPEESALPILPLAALTAVVAFMLTPVSAAFWHRIPEMDFLQFPWRLLALIAPVFAFAIALTLQDTAARSALLSTKTVFVSLVLCAALGLPAWHLFRQPCDPEDTAAARLALFHSNSGTDPTDEYTPTTADNDVLQPGNPAYWLTDSVDADGKATRDAVALRTAPMRIMIAAPHAQFLVLNLRDYPAWRVMLTRAGSAPQPVSQRSPRPDGLIAIRVPAGQSTIDVRYAQTADQTLGDAISLLALFVLGILIARDRPRIRRVKTA